MKVSIDKFSKVPVYLQIADQIKSQIISGALPRGSALPSERALAQILDVHRNTVVKAYSELKSDVWIESRQGVGYIVAAANDENDAQDERGGEGAQPGRVNWVSEVAEKYLDMEKTFDDLFQRFTDESHYSLGSGVASASCTRPSALRAISRRCSRAAARASIFSAPIRAINSCGRSSWPFSARRA